MKDVRLQKEAQISQLRSLNALLERQVADLEEERRKLRSEMKFRAKYHGQAALELGLTPDQLLLLEQYVEGLKHGTIEEARLVDQLSKRVSEPSLPPFPPFLPPLPMPLGPFLTLHPA